MDNEYKIVGFNLNPSTNPWYAVAGSIGNLKFQPETKIKKVKQWLRDKKNGIDVEAELIRILNEELAFAIAEHKNKFIK